MRCRAAITSVNDTAALEEGKVASPVGSSDNIPESAFCPKMFANILNQLTC